MQDMISDNFDEERVAALCEMYKNYCSISVKVRRIFFTTCRCSNSVKLKSLEITSYPLFMCIHISETLRYKIL